jgi:dTDP-4-dehydrorhamnose reductase
MSPRLLVFGRTGQVARELARRAPGATFLGREEADLTDPASCARAVERAEADAVVNAAAWTAVDRAEAEEAAATIVNGEAPAAMARAAAARGLPLVHLSTDYVFDGAGEAPFAPSDPVAPQNAYGRSKLRGEDGVRAAGGRAVILRTSWVFSAHGANFVRTMLRLGRERDEVSVVADQVGGPTPAAAIAEACLRVAGVLADGAEGGTHHLAGAPAVSWAAFAEAVMAEAGLSCRVSPIPSSAYPTPARRPLNSRLDGASLMAAFDIPQPDWQSGLREVVAELSGRGRVS